MKKYHVVFDFVNCTIPKKIEFARNVHTIMTGNASFPSPDVALTELKAKTDLLEAQNLAALNGGPPETALMHQTEKEWDDLMRVEARYVDRIANGDDAMILSSGFSLSKQPVPAVRPELSAEPGDLSGSVLLRRQAVPGAKAYIWQLCINVLPEAEVGWTIVEVTSKASVVLGDLTPLAKYWFRVAAVTAQGTSAYSAPIMQTVL
jgi:hypothetical protein